MPYIYPTIWEQKDRGWTQYDIYSRLLEDRIVFIGEAVDDVVANIVVAQLLYLQAADPEKDVHLYINTPGGSVYAGLAIYDTMQFIKPDVSTTCVGIAASMGAVLLAAGTKGKRYALPNARIMIHQPSGGFRGPAADVEIHAREILKVKEKLNDILAQHTGKTAEQIGADSDRDRYMSAEEAKEYGIVDDIFVRKEEIPGT